MEKYIPLSVVESEIDKLQESIQNTAVDNRISEKNAGMYRACVILKDFLDRIDTKDVDFETLLKEYGIDDEPFSSQVVSSNSARIIAKHFYDQGIMGRVNEEYVEEIISHLDSIRETADRMTTGNFIHNRAAIRFSANTIENVLKIIGIKRQNGE